MTPTAPRRMGRPPETTPRQLAHAIATNGGQVASQNELARITRLSRHGVQQKLAKLVAAGLVETFPGPRGAINYRLREGWDESENE